ncbi:thiamine-phosphate synthase [Planctomycetota bacterium]|nr:thiamine-phosphate synthase [Planctomycetota bacterium]
MIGRSAHRMIDANRNRAAEGLRVLEDVARFLLDDPTLARRAKDLRHQVRALPSDPGDRDTPGDLGTAIKAADEGRRGDLIGLIRANAARVQEALRCAEEACKVTAVAGAHVPGTGSTWATLEAARYATYTLESDLLARLPGWKLRSVRLYALIDPALCADPLAVAAAVARGGAGAVQLRAKLLTVRAYRELAARIQDAVRRHGALFIVNDHVAIARAIGADGVHVGQDDLTVADARAVVGAGCAIGLSCHTPEQVGEALRIGADYLGLGPIHGTTTKPHEPERGPGLLDAVAGTIDRPSYAIGGLDRDRVLALRGRIPHGIAVAGALCRAAEPEQAAAELLAALG